MRYEDGKGESHRELRALFAQRIKKRKEEVNVTDDK